MRCYRPQRPHSAPETLVDRAIPVILGVTALPLYQLYWITRYAGTRATLAHRVMTFISFLPIMAITGACWGIAWLVLIQLVIHVFR